MFQCIKILRFMQELFEDEKVAQQAAEIGQAILAAGSLRLTEISAQMSGRPAASYKRIQRFLHHVDPRQALWRLFQDQAEFVMGDPTEIERPQARHTPYVGLLKDGKTPGFWALILATPYRGRAIPCGLLTYSSNTIAQQESSRNLNHFHAFAELKDLLGERPLVLDREFSYLDLLLRLLVDRIHFVIRLNLGSQLPRFYDAEGQLVSLTISPGELVLHPNVWYLGQARLNLIGAWKPGLSQPLWIMTDLAPERGLSIYSARMKIEESFRDLKHLLGLTQVMNHQQIFMEKMMALLLLSYTVGLLVGERLRDYLYGEPRPQAVRLAPPGRIPQGRSQPNGGKWKRYSGLFILLKQKWTLSAAEKHRLLQDALRLFRAMVGPPLVRTYV